jgi:hypothetical protein
MKAHEAVLGAFGVGPVEQEIEDLLDSLMPKAQEEFASVLSKVDRLQKKIESLEEIMDSIRCDSVDDIDDIDFCEKFFADKVI